MTNILLYLKQLSSMFTTLALKDVLDVALVAVFIYILLRMVAHTRLSAIFKGVLIVVAVTALTHILELYTMSWILDNILSVGTITLVVLFAPEIRRWLEQLGRSEFARKVFLTATQHKSQPDEQGNRAVREIVDAYVALSRRKVGALIVIERKTPLTKIIETGTYIDSEISSPLIQNIFEPNTPLHDGAVIVSGKRIVAAACILELSDSRAISRELGTRHRAAIGVTENSDAVSLIVSEETGTISLARDGHLTRHLDEKSLTVLLTEFFTASRESSLISGRKDARERHEADKA